MHYELPAEEWLLVLDGNPTVREPDGEYRLEPMDVAFFAPGPRGAHQVRNDSTETARLLMWGENHYPAAAIYPDSNKIGIWTRAGEGASLYRLGTELDYYDVGRGRESVAITRKGQRPPRAGPLPGVSGCTESAGRPDDL